MDGIAVETESHQDGFAFDFVCLDKTDENNLLKKLIPSMLVNEKGFLPTQEKAFY